ncbi:hypothetical protein Ga0102493_11677 [Erythrobacter litoralis]|uniref:Phosphatidic acid phosphatase type 2/haloperoxidase domain-containing protein n=1 Tax=Erythrobacter litoralis TaxID=39960 RepID=A0A074MY61_9SPHN|nr:vanadium-dependent haloperoxidase [Erythrobacter litoralis]AOL24807.1 hypothetical protein Ga0102493_11677 [Erythrobacter litoralis]KEO96783.1 hypothetical protein EH32_08865 [Erythrobacter litoralis]
MVKTVVGALLASCFLAMPVRAEVVTDWAGLAQEIAAVDRTPWSVERHHINVRLGLAMFEAANAIDHKYESFLALDRETGEASVEAAVMTAAREVLSTYYPDHKQEIDRSYELALATLPDAGKSAGAAIGIAAAEAAIAMPATREGATFVRYRPVTTPGTYVPGALPAYADEMSTLVTLSYGNFEELMPPPPPSLTSVIWARDFNEVKSLGARDSTARDPVQTVMARYRITPVTIPALRSIADRPGRSTVDNARLYALINIADADTSVVTGMAKLRYNFWRPITAIRNADRDDNPGTEIDADWQPLLNTPNHPEYPCAHCSWTAAVAEVFKAEVGNAPEGGVKVGSRSLELAATQTLPTFDKWVEEVSYSRILGGAHFRFSNEAGERLGRQVAARTLTLLPPIEP